LKICKQCGKEFSSFKRINDKVRRFSERKYCLECFPYKPHKERIEQICKKCGKEIPKNIRVEGKPKAISRSFCFECQPYKSFRKNDLKTIETTGMKFCNKCNTTKPITFFSATKNSIGHQYCKECVTVINRKKGTKHKKQLIDYKGAQCSICGYSKYQGSLDFHHIDPSTKEFKLSNFKSRSFDNLKQELDKCVLLCSNCHREVHAGITSLENRLKEN